MFGNMKRTLGIGALAIFAGLAAAGMGSASAQAPQPSDEKPAELERRFDATGGSGDEGRGCPREGPDEKGGENEKPKDTESKRDPTTTEI